MSTTVNFLKAASLYYRDICPEQARFLMRRCQSLLDKGNVQVEVCPFCFDWRHPDNHHVRLKPRRRASQQVNQLLKREATRKLLSAQQTRILKRFRRSCSSLIFGDIIELMSCHSFCSNKYLRGSVLVDVHDACHFLKSYEERCESAANRVQHSEMATCHTCSRTTRQRGMSRETVAALSQNQRTPGATSKLGTPARTPQSAGRANADLLKSSEKTPSTTPSSKPSSMKKSALLRIKKFLLLNNNQNSEKGSLKDFLSSL